MIHGVLHLSEDFKFLKEFWGIVQGLGLSNS